MRDHLQIAEDKQIEIYRKMSPAEKWQEAFRLMQAARELKRAFFKNRHPEWSEEQVEDEVRRIFLYAST